MKAEVIFVVQGRGGMIHLATTDYTEAVDMKRSLDEGKHYGEKGYLEHWTNGKRIFREV